MKTNLNFEQEDTKKLLCKLDFEFFLKQNFEVEKYKQADIDNIYSNYETNLIKLKSKASQNKKQFHYFAEGQVRKMFTGGFLPALFELDESRGNTMFDFRIIGENWAYFEVWQTHQKQKVTKEKIWDFIVKTGSIFAILLSIIKLFEILNY